MSLTYADLVLYVRQHPKGNKVWKNWSDAQLAHSFKVAADNKALGYCTTKENKITGVVVGTPYPERKDLYITGLICDDKNTLRNFLKLFQSLYAGWTLSGNRKGKIITFKPNRLIC